MRKILLTSTLALMLSGCVLPPAIGVASIAVDVASYFFSGKTLTDHGISAIAQQDCALIRIMDGGLCNEYVDFEVADVTLVPLSPVDAIEIAAVSDVVTSISYFSEDAQLGAADPNITSVYSREIAAIDARTDYLALTDHGYRKDHGKSEGIKFENQLAEIFDDADYLADELRPIGFGG